MTDTPVVVSLVENAGRFLVIRRDNPEGNLSWTFPSGSLEPGETPEQAGEREVLEETSIVCQAFRKLGERRHPATNRQVIYLECRYMSGQPALRPEEAGKIAEARWMQPNEIRSAFKTDLFPAVKQRLGLD